MEYLLVRLFALAAVAISYGLTYYNWMRLDTEGLYSTRMAVMAPIGVVMSFFLFLFPKYVGKPETVSAKIIVMLVFVLSVAVGLYNLYRMDPSKFGL